MTPMEMFHHTLKEPHQEALLHILMLRQAKVVNTLTLKKLEPHQDNQLLSHMSQQPMELRQLHIELKPQETEVKLLMLPSQHHQDIQHKQWKHQPHQAVNTQHSQ